MNLNEQAVDMVTRQSTTRCLGDKSLDFNTNYHIIQMLNSVRIKHGDKFTVEEAYAAMDDMAKMCEQTKGNIRATFENLQSSA